jgi:hypothetical protein
MKQNRRKEWGVLHADTGALANAGRSRIARILGVLQADTRALANAGRSRIARF